jgi:trimethylamine:corrinoid methyltransferase-like protein
MNLADTLAVSMLLNAYDEAIDVSPAGQVGLPVDFRSACWAWGSPRKHLYDWLRARVLPVLCGVEMPRYAVSSTLLETSSSAIDFQAGMEKLCTCLMGARQGCRHFGGLGHLCVDDLYSPAQFVIDVEIVRYVRELIESFTPHADVFSTEGLYELCRACALGEDEFISHPDTVMKIRSILPSEGLIRREKLPSWLAHGRLLVDRAREEAIERMRRPLQFRLPDDKQRELDRIYAAAEAALSD